MLKTLFLLSLIIYIYAFPFRPSLFMPFGKKEPNNKINLSS